VIRFKKTTKQWSSETLFVVFKVAGDGTFNVIELGGNQESRYFRGIRAQSVEVVDVSTLAL
jgi:hypothetical protein